MQQEEKHNQEKSKRKTNFIKKLFCKHDYKVIGSVYASTGVSLAQCLKCGKYTIK